MNLGVVLTLNIATQLTKLLQSASKISGKLSNEHMKIIKKLFMIQIARGMF